MSQDESVMRAVREYEQQLDEYPASMPIMKRPLGPALWHLLVAHECVFHSRLQSGGNANPLYDAEDLKKALKHAVNWVHKYCSADEGTFEPSLSMEIYSEAIDLLMLGSAYQPIYCMFSMLNNRRRLVRAHISGEGQLHLEYDEAQLPFEALHFLTAEHDPTRAPSLKQESEEDRAKLRSAVVRVIQASEMLSEVKIHVVVDQEDYKVVKSALQRRLDESFRLPKQWTFRDTTIEEFRSVFIAISTLSFLDAAVHSEYISAASSEENGYPVFESVVWTGYGKALIERIVRYEPEIDCKVVESVVQYLIYDGQINKPDPALQPILQYKDLMMVPPRLILFNNPERNLVALLAREYKTDYDKTTGMFEPELLQELDAAFKARGFVTRTRIRIPGQPSLPDIDVLAFEPTLRVLILAEAKWVIAPGEPYEQLSRADTEESAIRNQLMPLVDYLKTSQASVMQLVGQDQWKQGDSISVTSMLIVRGFCGMKHELSSVYPTLEADFLLEALKSSCSNRSLLEWISTQKYLPKAKRDYEVHHRAVKFGPYEVVINGARLKGKVSDLLKIEAQDL